MSDSGSRTIVTLKWGDRYGPEFANRLFRATRRHMRDPAAFVCFTDNTVGLAPEIQTYPIPSIQLPPAEFVTGWRKLCLFREDLPIDGQCLFLDLDIVVTGPLDEFFSFGAPDSIPIIHNWVAPLKRWTGKDPMIGNSSVFRFRANECGFVWDQFHREKDWALTNFRPPQSYLTHAIRPKMTFWPNSWVRSFKRHCRPVFPMNYLMAPQRPTDARIVAFHGKPDPDEAVDGYRGRKLHHFTRPATWIRRDWLGEG